jgi:hypothetical protein
MDADSWLEEVFDDAPRNCEWTYVPPAYISPFDPDDAWGASPKTPQQMAQIVEEYPAGVLGFFLCNSEAFRERVRTVRIAGRSETVAFREARAYVSKGLGRRTIAWYLRTASAATTGLEMLGFLGGAGRRKLPRDRLLEPGTPVRFKLNEELTERGALLLVKRGEGLCFGKDCDTRLSRAPGRAVFGAARIDYCGRCLSRSRLMTESDAKAIKFVLDSAAALLLPDAPDRRRARRRERSKREANDAE